MHCSKIKRWSKLVPAAAGIALSISAATAANASEPDYFRWSGFYAGINAGYAWNDESARLSGDLPGGSGAGNGVLNFIAGGVFSTAYTPRSLTLGPDGFTGGGQLGYQLRVGPQIVLGIEGDFQGASVDDRSGVTQNPFELTVRHSLDWFGTLRGRLGYIVSKRLMVFGTGGLAVGKTSIGASVLREAGGGVGGYVVTTTISCEPTVTTTCLAGSSSDTSVGWTVGGGLEWALTDTVSLKAEYLRIDLGSQSARMTVQAPSTGDGFIDARVKNVYNIARVGLNVRF